MNQLGFLPLDQECSDITGFELHGREVAVVGLYNGTVFIDVTNANTPFELNRIPGDGSIWRDVKYWDNHVYIGTEADMGLQIVDVSDLDNIFLVNTISDFDNSHNIHIWEGYLFVIGADTYDIWIYDLSIPHNPILVGTWNEEYLHDIDVYNNKVYGMGIYSSTAYIIDISDITNPTTLTSWTYPGMAHDAAVFPDEQFLVTADEMEGGHLKIWDISNYNNITEISSFQIDNSHSIHNIYFKDNLIIGSWYADGTRILDVSDPYNPIEVGYFDTTEIDGLYVGNWGTYVYLPSGNIISSDIESGLYILEMGLSVNHNNLVNININEIIPIEIQVSSLSGEILNVEINFKDYFGNWETIEMFSCSVDNLTYCVNLPEIENETILKYYFYVENSLSQSVTYPAEGDLNPISVVVGELPIIQVDNIENSIGWTIGDNNDDATTGIWEFGIPNSVYVNSYNAYSQPGYDNSIDGENCFITGNGIGSSEGFDDIDGGKTSLISPMYDLISADEIWFNFYYWYSNNLGDNPGSDFFNVQYRSSFNEEWIELFSTNSSTNNWVNSNFFLSNYIDIFDQIQFKFEASDYYFDGDNYSGGSLVEAAIDDLVFYALYQNILFGDGNFDGNVDVTDIILMVNVIFGNLEPNEEFLINCDINDDDIINITDIVSVINIILY